LRGEEGQEEGHADDGVEGYYDKVDQDKHYKGSDWEVDEAGVEMVKVNVMKRLWLGCLKSDFAPEFNHRLHWTYAHARV
jgi:hypothetical protein